MRVGLVCVLYSCASAFRVEVHSGASGHEAHASTSNVTDERVICKCEAVARPELCSRSRTLTVRNTGFFCCAWWPRTGRGKRFTTEVGWESKKTFHGLPFSLAHSDVTVTGEAQFEEPVEENRRACRTHMRNKGLQAKNGDKCGLPGHCGSNCCCVWDNSLKALQKERIRGKCMTPPACKELGYKCLEKVNPTLSELTSLRHSAYKWTRVEDEAQATSYRWYHQINLGPQPWLKAGEPGVCFLLRRTGALHLGLGGVAALGSEAAKAAANMKVFHWDVNYNKSPYLSSLKESFVSRKEDLHIIQFSEQRCKKGDVFSTMVNKWGFIKEKMRLEANYFGTQLFGRSPKFTWVISANTGGLLEFRFAMMQSKTGNKAMGEIMDLNAKHAFLAHTEDYALYAGEAWMQFTPEAVTACARAGGASSAIIACLKGKMADPAKNAMLVLDNDSGTFKASPAIDIRSKVQKLLHVAWGAQHRINVCSLPGLIDDEIDNVPGAPCSDVKWVRSADLITTAKLM